MSTYRLVRSGESGLDIHLEYWTMLAADITVMLVLMDDEEGGGRDCSD